METAGLTRGEFCGPKPDDGDNPDETEQECLHITQELTGSTRWIMWRALSSSARPHKVLPNWQRLNVELVHSGHRGLLGGGGVLGRVVPRPLRGRFPRHGRRLHGLLAHGRCRGGGKGGG